MGSGQDLDERTRLSMTTLPLPETKCVIGPNGDPLTHANLPAPNTKRWVIRRKAEVVSAVRGGLLSLEEACSRYTLTVEEFLAWECSIERYGFAGLRATRIQLYRQRTDGFPLICGVFVPNGRLRRRYSSADR
jgi:hypothetical protein